MNDGGGGGSEFYQHRICWKKAAVRAMVLRWGRVVWRRWMRLWRRDILSGGEAVLAIVSNE
jgi:hypothetical protein